MSRFHFRLGRAQRVQRILTPQDKQPKYSNPYFPKAQLSVRKKAFNWFGSDGWAFGVAGCLVVGGIGFFLVKHSYFQITSIEVQGNQRISTEEIQNITLNTLNQPLLKFIPQDSYWVVRPQVIQNALLHQLKLAAAIDEITVQKKFPHTLRISLSERTPSMNWVAGETWYILDPEGVIVQAYATPEDQDQSLPRIIDLNQTPVQPKKQIVSSNYVNFLRSVQEKFSSVTGISIDHYEIPLITCQQKQFVAEKAIEEEIAQEENELIKEQMRDIQERFQSGEIDIDESLLLIEEVRQSGGQSEAETEVQKEAHIAFKAQYVAIGCDLHTVLTDVAVRTSGDQAGYLVYLDATLDLNTQLDNLNTVIQEKVTNPKALTYIDVRYTDRAYYK